MLDIEKILHETESEDNLEEIVQLVAQSDTEEWHTIRSFNPVWGKLNVINSFIKLSELAKKYGCELRNHGGVMEIRKKQK